MSRNKSIDSDSTTAELVMGLIKPVGALHPRSRLSLVEKLVSSLQADVFGSASAGNPGNKFIICRLPRAQGPPADMWNIARCEGQCTPSLNQ
eukprot:3988166-Amphidinium_carterae.1